MGSSRTNQQGRQDDRDAAKCIAVISATYPARSETFVYREVHGLREHGWRVVTVGLREPGEPAEALLGADEPPSISVYGRATARTITAAARELVFNPVRSLHTLAAAAGDALTWRPGETARRRVLILPQAIAAIGLAARLRDAGVAFIHCHFAHAPSTIGMYAAMQIQVPFSFVGHANDLYQRRVLLEPKLRRAAFVSCISTFHRAMYGQLVDRDAAAYPVIRCGVDTEQFQAKRLEAGSEPGRNLLTISRLVEKKGIDTLIRAFAQLRAGDPSWQLTIAGTGPDEQRLRELAQQLGCDQAIQWSGAVDTNQVQRMMSDADVFVLPCRQDRNGDRDGIPVVLMEAMARGLPVISGDIDSIRDLVRDGHTGLLVPGGDAPTLAGTIDRLCGDQKLRSRLAANARRHVVAEFSQATNIRRLDGALAAALQWVCAPAEHVIPPDLHAVAVHRRDAPGPAWSPPISARRSAAKTPAQPSGRSTSPGH